MLEIKGQKRAPLVPMLTPYDLLYISSLGHRENIAVEEKGQLFIRQQMLDDVKNLAAALADLGVSEGDIVTTYTARSMYANLLIFFALNRLGAVACFHDESVAREVVLQYQNEFRSSVMFVYNQTPEYIVDLQSECDCLTYVINMKISHDEETYQQSVLENFTVGEESLDAVARGARRKRPRAPMFDMDREALISFTSGSTSGPKPMVFTNRNLTALAIYSKGLSGVKMWDKQMHSWLSYVHLDCPYGLVVSALSPILSGGKLIVTPDLDYRNINYYLAKKPDVIFAVPSLLEDLPSLLDPAIRLTNLKAIACGGERLEEAASQQITEFLQQRGARNVKICNGYGTGETLGFVSSSMGDVEYRPETVGMIPPGVEVMIEDPETGEELGFNQPGIICVSGDHILTRYYNREELTAEKIRITPEGKRLLVTGDTGYVSEDGYLTLVGRATFFINNVPAKVYYEVVRTALVQSKLVQHCCVVKGPDEDLKWAPCAFIVLQPGEKPTQEVATQILETAKEPFKIGDRRETLKLHELPTRMIFLEKLPLTKANKVDFLELEKRLEEGTGFADFGEQAEFDLDRHTDETRDYGKNIRLTFLKTILTRKQPVDAAHGSSAGSGSGEPFKASKGSLCPAEN